MSRERFWISNYSLNDIMGGTEIVGKQYCKSMNLKYMSARSFGIDPNQPSEELSMRIDERLHGIDIDVLVYNSTNCWYKKPLANKSIVVCCENFKTESECLPEKRFIEFKLKEWERQKMALGNAEEILVLSESERNAFEDEGFESTIIEPYVDLEKFQPKESRKHDKLTALFVGRRHDRKGYDIIRELEKMMPEIRFAKITDGELSTDELVRKYNHSDFLIMPSRYESFGFIYAEALAMNLPIISSRVGLFGEWQPTEYGIFPDEITVQAFEEAIHSFTSKKFEKSRELAEERFSYERFKRDCDDLLGNW